jgi:L-asparaginase
VRALPPAEPSASSEHPPYALPAACSRQWLQRQATACAAYHVHLCPGSTAADGIDWECAMDELLIVTTGGTIDKIYFDDKSDYQIGDPQIELGVTFRFNVIPILRKDSLHITDADRELIRATIAAQPTEHVLVTHGTDSMVATGQVLQSIPGKTIVMTGALSPARFRGSDAEFNIGCAIGAVQSLPAGVYIAMNGRIWDPTQVRKNVAENRFEPI